MSLLRRAWDIRRALPGDGDQLRSFRCQNRGEKWTRDVERLIRTDVADEVGATDSTVSALVAVEHRLVVGVVAFGPEVEGQLHIYALAVIPERRRQGIATALKQRVLDRAAKNGLEIVSSAVHRRNTPMISLNRKMGVGATKDPTDGEYYLTAARVTEEALWRQAAEVAYERTEEIVRRTILGD